ncbi:SCY1-like protein 2 [Diadema setosum]|uniref:SCY1-like protein 2 n=1 Tax=Diadema setosum TaxID=31175 RepID=UPI003B3BDF65
MPSPPPADVSGHKLFDVEIKYGFLQLIDALKFLHNDVHMIHGNIDPRSVILNSNGAWKLAGFDFVIPSSTPPDQPAMFSVRELSSDASAVVQPNLNYLAPEYLLTQSCDTASDMFSLGMLMYAVKNNGSTLYDCNENLPTFRGNTEQLRSLNISQLKSLPDGQKEYVKMLLSATPTIRPDVDQLSKIPFFDDVGAMTLQYVDSLFQQDNQQKAQFFKGLPKVISQLPKRVVTQRILPCLCKEFINPDMVPFVLPNVLHIAEQCSDQEYVRLVLPGLKPVFKMQEPVQILLIFMQRMQLLLTKTPAEDIKNHVLPMVYRALESSSTQVQELCLTILPSFAGMIEYNSIKHSIVPRIKKLCLETSLLSIRVGCLVSLGKMLEHLDKWYVLDEVLPLLTQIPSREPAVLMAMLGIIKVSLSHKKLGITKDIAATKVLPFLFPLCIDNNLNLSQFNAYMAVIHELIGVVEKEQRIKLEQLNAMQEEQRTSVEFAQKLQNSEAVSSAFGGSETSGGSGADQVYQSLGLDAFSGQSKSPSGQVSSKSQEDSPRATGGAKKAEAVRPANVSLSLEEKQRLQKEQEFQQRLKSQKPIKPSETAKEPARSQAKDLTTSLMQTSIGSPLGPGGGGGIGGGGGWSGGVSNGFTSSAAINPFLSAVTNSSGFSPGLGSSGMSGPTSTSNASLLSQPVMMPGSGHTSQSQGRMFQTTAPSSQSQTNRSVDMSAFDSLLGPSQSQKTRPSLNQMSSQGQGSLSSANQGSFRGMSPGQSSFAGPKQMPQQGVMGGGFAGMGGMQSGVMPSSLSWQPPPAPQTQPQSASQNLQTGSAFDPFAASKTQTSGQQQKSNPDSLLDFLG